PPARAPARACRSSSGGGSLSSCNSTSNDSFSIVGQAPGHHGKLDHGERHAHREQVPVPQVVGVMPPQEEADRENGRRLAGDGGGLAAVREEALVDETFEDAHLLFSSQKMRSTGQPNTRANA